MVKVYRLPECIVSCDLHLEHLNRRLKDMIRKSYSNVTPKALVHASRSVGIVHQVCDKLSKETGLHKKSGCHTRPSFTKECTQMVKQLEEQRFSRVWEGNQTHQDSRAYCSNTQSNRSKI